MKTIKISIALLMTLFLLWGQISICQSEIDTRSLGGYSSVCGPITETDKQWVMEHFGDCNTVEELMIALELFGCTNFKYTNDALRLSQRIIQYYNLGAFIASDYRGVCFDFSCFCKNVILIVCQEKSIPVRAYVCSIRYAEGPGHALNIIYTGDGTGYYLDLTADSTYYQKGESIWGPLPLGDKTPDAFLKDIFPDVCSIHLK